MKTKPVKTKLNRQGMKAFFGTALGPVIPILIVFLFARTVMIPQALLLIAVSLPIWSAGAIVMLRKNPELLNLRGGWIKDLKYPKEDKIVVILFGLFAFYFSPMVIGLEHLYFGLPTLSLPFMAGGFVIYGFSALVFYHSMMSNPFFEGGIRIQKDRKQKVISTGPYEVVRHPAYMATIFMALSVPVALGSVYGVIPALIAGLIFVYRTNKEDKVLMAGLKDYKDYAERVQYKLLPGLW